MLAGENLLELDAADVQRAHLRQRRQGLIKDGCAPHFGRVLRQISDARALGAGNAAGVRLDQPGDHAQKR